MRLIVFEPTDEAAPSDMQLIVGTESGQEADREEEPAGLMPEFSAAAPDTDHVFWKTLQRDTQIIDGVYYLRDISIWFPDHWTTEVDFRAQGYVVEFSNPATNRREANYTRAEVFVEWDLGEILTAQDLLDMLHFSGDIERHIIEIDGVEAAWTKSRILNAQIARTMGLIGIDDTGRIIEHILIPHNDTLYTIQFIYSATWQRELDIFSAMRDSIMIR